MRPVTRYTLAGFAYGTLLFIFSFVTAGFGHGTYFPFAISGAPLSFVPVAGLFAAPLFWTMWAFLAARTWRFNLPLALLLLHAVGALVVLWSGSYFESAEEQWNSLRAMYGNEPGLLWFAFATYFTGQAVCWRVTTSKRGTRRGLLATETTP